MGLLVSFIASLFITIIIESFLASPLLFWKKWKVSIFLDLLLINCVTNPVVVAIANLLWFLLGYYSTEYVFLILTFIEIIVVFVEGWLLRKFNPKLGKKAYLISLYLNCISYLCSFLFI